MRNCQVCGKLILKTSYETETGYVCSKKCLATTKAKEGGFDARLTRDQFVNHFGDREKFSYMGHCRRCTATLYAVLTGGGGFEADPRGLLGQRHCYYPAVAAEHDMTGPDVPFCYACLGDNRKDYETCLALAKQEWTTKTKKGG